ncbi:hypothetical protein I5393_11880 [Citrobacter freundii]|uniref:hypothetical protein n=1 Tax=Citrobacter freundii TaxID=546 RepID=UPI00190079BC|nr:hypothetical protein [Citrobacter freundii]MBJ8769083.1 hypothetical protein [Citrobacter freundii]
MKKIAFILAFLLTACSAHPDQEPQDNVLNTQRIIINYSEGSKAGILDAAKRSGMPVIYEMKNMNIIVLGVSQKDSDREIKRFEKMDGVLGVQKDRIEATVQ